MIVLMVGTAYLIGSIPVAWIIAKLVTGEDLRELSSGNAGVMNMMVSVSRWAGLLLFLAEAGKGILAVLLARAFNDSPITIGIAVLAVVVGTRWSVWLRFRGGRGNTAGIGALLVLSWPALLLGLASWGLLRFLLHSSFWATRLNFFVWPLLLGFMLHSYIYGLFGVALSAIYLSTQSEASDDHIIIKEQWPSFWAFLTAPSRHHLDDH